MLRRVLQMRASGWKRRFRVAHVMRNIQCGGTHLFINISLITALQQPVPGDAQRRHHLASLIINRHGKAAAVDCVLAAVCCITAFAYQHDITREIFIVGD